MSQRPDHRHHVQSPLMRESLVDTELLASTEAPVVRMLPDVHVVKIGASSILDHGPKLVHPLVAAVRQALKSKRLVIGTGGGSRSRQVFSVRSDLGPAMRCRCFGPRPHPRNAACPRRRGGHSTGDVWTPSAAVHPRRPRGGFQRRSAVFALGASALVGPNSAPSSRRGLLSAVRDIW